MSHNYAKNVDLFAVSRACNFRLMNLIGLDRIKTGNRLNIMIDRATCYYTNFSYIFFFLRFVKTRVACSFETPSHLSLNHLKSLLGRKCLLPLINPSDLDMNYLIPDTRAMATTCRFMKGNLRVGDIQTRIYQSFARGISKCLNFL